MWQVPPGDNNNSYSSGGNSAPQGAQSCLQELAWTWGSYVPRLFAVEDNGRTWAGELCRLRLSPWLSESAWKAAHACMHHSSPQDQEQKTSTCKGQTLPAAEQLQCGSLAHCLVMEGSRTGGEGSSTA